MTSVAIVTRYPFSLTFSLPPPSTGALHWCIGKFSLQLYFLVHSWTSAFSICVILFSYRFLYSLHLLLLFPQTWIRRTSTAKATMKYHMEMVMIGQRQQQQNTTAKVPVPDYQQIHRAFMDRLLLGLVQWPAILLHHHLQVHSRAQEVAHQPYFHPAHPRSRRPFANQAPLISNLLILRVLPFQALA